MSEQLLFTTTTGPVFLLDEPAAASHQFMAAFDSHTFTQDVRDNVAAANVEALCCNFVAFNSSFLQRWQGVRGDASGLSLLREDRTFAELQHACSSAQSRALKSIRMIGSLGTFFHLVMGNAGRCLHEPGQVRVVMLVRHPFALMRSRNSHQDALTGGASPNQNTTHLCHSILTDVRALLEQDAFVVTTTPSPPAAPAPARCHSGNSRYGHGCHALVKYSDLIQSPELVALRLHAQLGLLTDETALRQFVASHFLSEESATEHLRDQSLNDGLKTERLARRCSSLTPLEGDDCSSLLELLHPLYDC